MNYRRHFECGCKVVVIGEITNAQIEYCPKHKAAPDLYEALKELTSSVTIMGYFHPSVQAKFKRAVSKAEEK